MKLLLEKINTIIQKLPLPENKLFWILLAIVAKSIFITYFLFQANQTFPDRMHKGVIFMHNDYAYFQKPVERYMDTGKYEYREGKAFAGRMPGYTIPYLFIRQFFEKDAALVAQILTQILLSFIAVYYLALIAKLLFKKDIYFYFTYALALISIFTNTYDFFTLAESYATSAMIFHAYFLLLSFKEKQNLNLFISGIFLTWAIFCRPFLGISIVITPLILLTHFWKTESLLKAITIQVVFLSSFVLAESAWIIRNYIALDKFVPLETSFEESYDICAHKAARTEINNLIMSWGGIIAGYYPYNTEGAWFLDGFPDQPLPFPDYAFNSTFNLDSIVSIKEMYQLSCDESLSPAFRDSIELEIIKISKRYASDYRADNLFRYYIINPVKRFRRYVLVSGTNDVLLPPFGGSSIFNKLLKLSLSALYLFVLLAGILGILWKLLYRRNPSVQELIILSIPLINIITVTLVAQDAQVRYLSPVFPFLIVWCVYLILDGGSKIFPSTAKDQIQ